MEVERLLRRERPDGPGAREEYLQEQRRAELAGPGKEHHRAREPDVERRDARHQAEPVTVLERVEQERERVGHDAVLAQEIEARAEAARPFVPDDDADRSEVERRELEAVALAESPDVCQPILAPDGPRRVARIREDARRPHQLEAPAVQCRVVEPLHSRDRIARMPVHDSRTRVGASQRVVGALVRRIGHVRVLDPHRGLVEAHLDDGGVAFHRLPVMTRAWRHRVSSHEMRCSVAIAPS